MSAQIELGGNWYKGEQQVGSEYKALNGQLVDLKGETVAITVYPFKGGTWVGIKQEMGFVSFKGRVKVKPEGVVLYGSKGAVEMQLPGDLTLKVVNQVKE